MLDNFTGLQFQVKLLSAKFPDAFVAFFQFWVVSTKQETIEITFVSCSLMKEKCIIHYLRLANLYLFADGDPFSSVVYCRFREVDFI